jgi:hypothetical protein
LPIFAVIGHNSEHNGNILNLVIELSGLNLLIEEDPKTAARLLASDNTLLKIVGEEVGVNGIKDVTYVMKDDVDNRFVEFGAERI